MKVLILGGKGMLGHKLVQKFQDKFEVWTSFRNNNFRTSDSVSIDFKNNTCRLNAEIFETVEKLVEQIRPDVIVNAIGIIKQLPDSKNIIKTLTINSIFPNQLAILADAIKAKLINISTDCVFSGVKGNYTENDTADATDLYGRSKNFGEVVLNENCLTLRTSIIGRELETNHSLVEWFLSQTGKKVKGYKNAIFSGFPTVVFADIIADLIANHKEMHGLYHISSQPINKFDLLVLLKKAYQLDIEIEPFEEIMIDRSLNSTKFRNETNFQPSTWDEMIEKMVRDPFPYRKIRK